jgi:hypothetical protein
MFRDVSGQPLRPRCRCLGHGSVDAILIVPRDAKSACAARIWLAGDSSKKRGAARGRKSAQHRFEFTPWSGCDSRAAVARSISKLLYSDGNLRSSRIGAVTLLQLGRVEA